MHSPDSSAFNLVSFTRNGQGTTSLEIARSQSRQAATSCLSSLYGSQRPYVSESADCPGHPSEKPALTVALESLQRRAALDWSVMRRCRSNSLGSHAEPVVTSCNGPALFPNCLMLRQQSASSGIVYIMTGLTQLVRDAPPLAKIALSRQRYQR